MDFNHKYFLGHSYCDKQVVCTARLIKIDPSHNTSIASEIQNMHNWQTQMKHCIKLKVSFSVSTTNYWNLKQK